LPAGKSSLTAVEITFFAGGDESQFSSVSKGEVRDSGRRLPFEKAIVVQFNIGTLPDQFRNAPKTRPVLDCGGKWSATTLWEWQTSRSRSTSGKSAVAAALCRRSP
jgi:hypothetical protein